jgi:hypothetical protein
MEIGNVLLNVNVNRSEEVENVLYQNEPNPFKDITQISYLLAEEGLTIFRVFNVEGKLIMKRTVESNKGFNILQISNQELRSTRGILYYQIESGDFTDTKKMIILE